VSQISNKWYQNKIARVGCVDIEVVKPKDVAEMISSIREMSSDPEQSWEFGDDKNPTRSMKSERDSP
jgi:hypothetical protein